jgi:hypothetical protein
MAVAAEDAVHKISRPDAELLVRGWNLLYNRCLSYSFPHPLVQETLPKVQGLFDAALKKTGSLNLMLQEAMYFVDSVDVMYQPNNRRVADHLRRFGLESITLLPGFSAKDFGMLIDACSLIHPSAEAFSKYLHGRGCLLMEVNKVSLRAVKEGEELVAAGSRSSGMGFGGTGGGGDGNFQDIVMRAVMGRLTAQEMEGNLLLAQMLAQPDSLGKAMAEGIDGAPADKGNVQDMLMGVLSQFAHSSKNSGHSLEELMTGIYSMRSEMLNILKSQKSLDETLGEEEIHDVADVAFDRTVCQIASDDWIKSNGNAKRLATVLTRVVPGRKDLKRLLPKLKDTLLEKGATLQQWYQLVSEITNLFGTEKAMEQLAEVAAEFGVTTDEVVGELQRDPRSAARLILASAEIRRMGGADTEDRMIQAMLDAVEQAGDRLADAAGNAPRDAAALAATFDKLRHEMGQELAGKSMDNAQRQAALKKLENRSQRGLVELKARAFASQLKNPDLSQDDKAGLLEELSSQEGELDNILDSALSLLGEDDVAKQIAQEIVNRLREKARLEREKKAGSELPQGVYPRAVAEFFLRYELLRAGRYNVSFSALLVSFQGLPEDAEALKDNDVQLRGLANLLSGELRLLLRDVDFVGYMGYNRFFVVLPMTPEASALRVVRKLKDQLARQVALPSGRAWVRPRVGLASVDGGQKIKLQEIYEAASRKWQEDL